MATWPKTIFIRGIAVQIESWDEFDEVVERYGSAVSQAAPAIEGGGKSVKPQTGARFDPRDRALLRSFIDHSSLSTSQVAQALGKQGKAIRSGLDDWAHKIGLSNTNTSPFEPCFRADGRGYRLLPHFKDVAKLMMGEQD